MKKILFITFLILITSLPVLAYTLEVKIPGSKLEGPVDLVKYINGIYKFAFIIIGIVVFGSLVFAGIQYMSSVAVGEIQAAKDRIWSTIGGLFLVLAIALIFKTVNPTLLNTNLPNITPVASCGDKRDIGNGNESIKGFCKGLREVCIESDNGYECDDPTAGKKDMYGCISITSTATDYSSYNLHGSLLENIPICGGFFQVPESFQWDKTRDCWINSRDKSRCQN